MYKVGSGGGASGGGGGHTGIVVRSGVDGDGRVGRDSLGNGYWLLGGLVLVTVVALGLVQSRFHFCFWEQDIDVEVWFGVVVGRFGLRFRGEVEAVCSLSARRAWRG